MPTDPLIRAFDSLDQALTHYARWPWSRHRREALIVALNTVLVLHLDAVARAVSEEVGRLEVQQGRHEVRISRLEARGEQEREVGSGGGDGAL